MRGATLEGLYVWGQYLALRPRSMFLWLQASIACWLLLPIEDLFVLLGGGPIMRPFFKFVFNGACPGCRPNEAVRKESLVSGFV